VMVASAAFNYFEIIHYKDLVATINFVGGSVPGYSSTGGRQLSSASSGTYSQNWVLDRRWCGSGLHLLFGCTRVI